MARRASPPGNPQAVLSELEDHELLAVEILAAAMDVPADVWPELDELLGPILHIACRRRIDRRQKLGDSLNAAILHVAEIFGLEPEAVRAAHYRRSERARKARSGHRKKLQKATDTAIASASPSFP